MRIISNKRAPMGHLLRRAFALCLTAALLIGGSFAALPSGSALAAGTCRSIADGSWNNSATWDCGRVPATGDDVVVDSEVSLDSDQGANNLVINHLGILTVESPVTLTLQGNMDVQGIFDDHEGGTVMLAGADQAILTHGDWVDFSKLVKIASQPGESLSVDPANNTIGGIHILDDLTLKGAAPDYLALRSTVAGSPWQINVRWSFDIDWVDVQDSTNTSAFGVDVLHGIDSGDNVGWAISGMLASSAAVTSSASLSFEHRPVTFTATVAPANATGAVAFQDGGLDIPGCEAQPLASGVATCTTADLALGSHDITAVYSGDAIYTGSTSAPIVQQIVELESTIFLPIITKQ